ncbi:hypothetical protein [Photobacterium indicum]|uniref:hypothetical protein n=1 Tax=Photobacterium indicum TaxID=81447 RepID=UPI003D0FF8EE
MIGLDEKIDARMKILLSDYFVFEEKIHGLSGMLKNEMKDVNDYIHGLESALKVVPAEYDQNFGKKLNRILDVATELEHFAKIQRAQLKESFSDEVKMQGKLLSQSLSKDISKDVSSAVINNVSGSIDRRLELHFKNNSNISFWTAVVLLSTCTVIGGGILAAIFYFSMPYLI